MKIHKIKIGGGEGWVGVGSGGGGVGSGEGVGLEGQGGCEQRIEAFVKIQKKIFIFFFFRGGGVCSGWGGESGWM